MAIGETHGHAPGNHDMMSTVEVAAATGATYREIDHWIRKGYISASDPAHGSGSKRRFSVHDVVEVACVATLVRFGIRPNVAAVIVRSGGHLTGGDVTAVLDVDAVRARVIALLGHEPGIHLVD